MARWMQDLKETYSHMVYSRLLNEAVPPPHLPRLPHLPEVPHAPGVVPVPRPRTPTEPPPIPPELLEPSGLLDLRDFDAQAKSIGDALNSLIPKQPQPPPVPKPRTPTEPPPIPPEKSTVPIKGPPDVAPRPKPLDFHNPANASHPDVQSEVNLELYLRKLEREGRISRVNRSEASTPFRDYSDAALNQMNPWARPYDLLMRELGMGGQRAATSVLQDAEAAGRLVRTPGLRKNT